MHGTDFEILMIMPNRRFQNCQNKFFLQISVDWPLQSEICKTIQCTPTTCDPTGKA